MKPFFSKSGVMWVMVAIFVVLMSTSCAQRKPAPPQLLPVLLIQGVHIDASGWAALKAALDPNVYDVRDIGRSGYDQAEATLTVVAQSGCQAALPGSLIVAHSYGGAVVNRMMSLCAEKVGAVIYVAAVVPREGEKPFQFLTPADQKNYAKAVDFKKTKIIPRTPQAFFAATDRQVKIKGVLPKLHAESQSLIAEIMTLNAEKFNAVPKSYVITAKDPVIGVATQMDTANRVGIKLQHVVETGHYPMLSDPKALAAIIASDMTEWGLR